MKNNETIRTDIAWSNEDRILVHGLDLPLENYWQNFSLGDFAFLELTGRKPNEDESIVFNALAVTLVEHGLTPSVFIDTLDLSRRTRIASRCCCGGPPRPWQYLRRNHGRSGPDSTGPPK